MAFSLFQIVMICESNASDLRSIPDTVIITENSCSNVVANHAVFVQLVRNIQQMALIYENYNGQYNSSKTLVYFSKFT
jgi:hypothetical protein